MALNFGLLGDAGAPAMGYLQGQQDVARNQLAQQQVETGRMTQDKMRMEMDAMKRRQAGLDQFMQKAKELGVDGDPEQLARAFYDQAIATSDPQQIQAATIAVQAARERKAYMASLPGASGAVATPVPMTNNLGTALPPAGAPPMPFSAGAAPAAAPSQGNALAGNRLSQIDNRLVELRRYPTEGAQERADLIKERDRLMTPHVVGDSLVTLGGATITAPAKTKQTDLMANYQAALGQGFKGSIFDYEKQIKEAGRAPAAPRPEPAPRTQQVTLSDGSLGIMNMDTAAITAATLGGAPAMGKDSSKTAVSEQQATYNIGRILTAATQIKDITTKNPSAVQPGGAEAFAASIGMGGTANLARDADRQIVYGAQKDALDAMLYLATGAAYNKEQLEGQIAAYIPAFTDKPETVAAKKVRMTELIKSAKTRAGKAWTPEMDSAVKSLTSSSAPPAAPAGGGKWKVIK